MHLKTLTIRGFKSFASATTFQFEPGVTAVVGPNGSGKSNVVDALAWVMGEQGAKSLRGGSMEDVIFAGTAERQALGRASVSLTIDNTDGALPIEYSEVTISRTMFRTGGSEYTINGSPCRLLDIQELLSDSGLGREMHVIVGQGQLDQILQATPEQRRGFIEEAAGVLKHRRRRERTVRKLENMQGNLQRLEDLVTETSRQLAPLGRQAKVARRAQRIQHDVRDALSRIIADDLVQAATALAESSQGEASDVQAAEQLKHQVETIDAQIAELAGAAEAARSRAEALGSGHHRLAQVQERLRSVAQLAAERARSLTAVPVRTDSGRDPERLRAQAEEVLTEAGEVHQQVDAARAELETAGQVRAEAERALAQEENRITEQLRAAADKRAGLATLRGRVETVQGRIEAAQQRRTRAEQQRQADQAALESSAADLEELRQRSAEFSAGVAELAEQFEQARETQQHCAEQHQQRTVRARDLEILVSEQRARLSGLEAAVAAADEAVALDDPGAAFRLDVVQAQAAVQQRLREVLAEAVLVGESSFGEELVSRGEAAAALAVGEAVIKDGERIRSGVSSQAGDSLAEQIEALRTQIEQTQRQLEQAQAEAEDSAAALKEAEARTAEAREAHQAREAAIASTAEQLQRLTTEVERAEERIETSQQEIDDAEAASRELQAQKSELEARLQAAESDDVVEDPSTAERDRLAEEASRRRREEVDARLALRAAEEQHKQLSERAASLRRSAQAEEHRREQEARAARARAERAQRAEQIGAEAEAAVAQVSQQLSEAEVATQHARAEHRELSQRAEQLRGVRAETAQQLEAVTARLHAAEVKQTELRLALEAAESRAQEELSLSAEYLIEHYGPDQPVPDPDAEAPGEGEEAEGEVPTRPYNRAEQEARLARARKDLKALGKVNPLALEEHAALEERHQYLQQQLADLKQSRQDLLAIIREVDAEVERVFAAAWEDTKEQFERVFSRLFPGGEGRLELTNPEDLLTTGIEVHARPPGKRIRRLSLLSGGERSLTAVALLVAIFKARPSPFYVMDEVEAALDDTNLSRLLVIFEELRESSQLIVITHQKRTMEIADALYGVSMRQDGSTRVVSQRLRGIHEGESTKETV
ncbi:chromosome segregation SMC family protein [Nesterenkonia alba]|uniref:chromosome segregation SMC family protein n=1 Tax=Nesterenkonia alba TaxID=515814 RepID=UPI0003B467E7|nr:AAA family ATPase [Nesterenkonia alba]